MVKRKAGLFFGIIGVVLAAFWLVDTFWGKRVSINGQNFVAELARSSQAYERGLGGREVLCSSCAMLFIFPGERQAAFWMKDMNFDLDILWIKDQKIVYIKKNFPANSSEVVRPAVFADSVLEIGAGMSERYNFKIGDRVRVY